MAKIKKYNSSDVWLLLSIIYAVGAKGTAALEKIIGAGDYINHAVFNADELESGLARLTAGNFIREKNKNFAVTHKVKRAYGKTTSPRRAPSQELGDITQFIGAANAADEQSNSSNLKYAGFSPEEFREAFNKYLKS